jgi:hypothetical protein
MNKRSILNLILGFGFVLLIGLVLIPYGTKAGEKEPGGVLKLTFYGMSYATPFTYGTITVRTQDGNTDTQNFVYGQTVYYFGFYDPHFVGTACATMRLYNVNAQQLGSCIELNGIGWNPPTGGPSVFLVRDEI